MKYTDRINKLCELYSVLRNREPRYAWDYIAYRNDDYFSFEKINGIEIIRSRFGTIEFTTRNPSEIQSDIEELLTYFEQLHNFFVQK